ncbi:hypothetical protein [Rhizobium leguminosarum]|uniref:hypothetical protein n=1 Tax=Rhizobium leguminosarum TaxID=384 RepID=UPI00102F4BDA|nr:hypothetical protein [Rhizobium leguminosarum]TAY98674.1 hypothetical protein ELH79_09465 [Rhizobium leguminosarum]TAZ09439.1 hypothetical protein ELH78_09465 [Rhizobium leguminosarum]
MASHEPVHPTNSLSADAVQQISGRPTVKGPTRLVFRSKTAADLSCLLDLDPQVVSWSCVTPSTARREQDYIPDFLMDDIDGGRWMLDAPGKKLPDDLAAMSANAAKQGARYRLFEASEIYDGFRLRNARDLLRYVSHGVPLGDRMRVLATLDEQGPLPFGDCLRIIRETQPVAALASMILQGFIEVELDEALLGPETMVRRIRG